MPRCANGVPLYSGVEPEPITNAPPWIHTTTGYGLGPAPAASPTGANTLTNRQSSPDAILSPTPLRIAIRGSRDCAATGPNSLASRTPDHAGAGRGGRNLSAPSGASAYGIPRQLATSPWRSPRTRPVVVSTT